jgi:protein-disulfide isomerase
VYRPAGNGAYGKMMKSVSFIGGAIAAGLILFAPQASRAQDLRGQIEAIVKDYLATHPDEVGQIVKDYLTKHPEVLGDVLADALRHPTANPSPGVATGTAPPPAPDHSAVIASNADQLFSSPHQVTLGNPDGDVTLVEFFDYNCGFCKRALPDMLTLLKDDPKLKIVLKEFPILGPGSLDAARVAVAVRMEDPGGQKYLAFHQELLGDNGPASKEKALAAAKDQGFDPARLERDMTTDEVSATIAENMKLANAVGATGTPTYVIGKELVVGAIGVMGLKGEIDTARGQAAH